MQVNEHSLADYMFAEIKSLEGERETIGERQDQCSL